MPTKRENINLYLTYHYRRQKQKLKATIHVIFMEGKFAEYHHRIFKKGATKWTRKTAIFRKNR